MLYIVHTPSLPSLYTVGRLEFMPIFLETDQTEMNCGQLGAIKHDRKMITATHFNFLDD